MPRIEISKNTSDRYTYCPFPKHKDKLWAEVIEEDREYVEWLVSMEGPDLSDMLYDFLIDLLEEEV